MPWVQGLPLILRSLPAAVIVLLALGVLVFLARHPVDGDARMIELISRYALEGFAFLGISAFFLMPTWVTLALLVLLLAGLSRFGDELLRVFRGRLDDTKAA